MPHMHSSMRSPSSGMASGMASCSTSSKIFRSGQPNVRGRQLQQLRPASWNNVQRGDARVRSRVLQPAASSAGGRYAHQLRFKEDNEANGRSTRPFMRRFTREDYEALPHRVILVRHAESMGNVEKDTYCLVPDHEVVLTENGRQQALDAGKELCDTLTQIHGNKFKMFMMTSPYCRTVETTDLLLEAFSEEQVLGVRSAVQLREQDFGNFQDPQRINQDLSDRLRFGRFWFRFPNGESGADVYDRITIFEDHLTRDMLMGRFTDSSLVLVTHGLTMRVFLMRWFHWSVDEMLRVFNPGNCIPITLEKLPWDVVQDLQNNRYVGVKQCFAITPQSLVELQGCTRGMASYLPRNLKDHCPKASWKASRKTRGPIVEESAPEMEVSGNWLYGYYCSVPQQTMQHSSWANTGEVDKAVQSEDEAASWLETVSRLPSTNDGTSGDSFFRIPEGSDGGKADNGSSSSSSSNASDNGKEGSSGASASTSANGSGNGSSSGNGSGKEAAGLQGHAEEQMAAREHRQSAEVLFWEQDQKCVDN